MSAENEMYHEEEHEPEKKKKQRTRYDSLVIERTDEAYVRELSERHIFKTTGKAILIVKNGGDIPLKNRFGDKGIALNEAVSEKLKNPMAKVKLLLEI